MPTFPKYRGELPQCLNPLNLRHYWLLVYWVYFRPTALHCYFYQAAPECYQLRGLSKVRRTWHIPAYRNLYLMTPAAVLLFALLVGLLVGLYQLYQPRFLSGHSSYVNYVVISPDGKIVVSGSADKKIKFWDFSTGREIRTQLENLIDINDFAISPDWQTIATGGSNYTIKIWDFSRGEVIGTLTGHTSYVNSLAISPDGKNLVSGSADNTIKVWDLSTGKEIHTFIGHTSHVNSLAISPDGKNLVSGSADNTIKVWDLSTGKKIHTFIGHTSLVKALDIGYDGKTLVSGSADKTIKIWDFSTGELLNTLTGHTSYVNSLAVTPDGKFLISGSADNTLRIWDLDIGMPFPLPLYWMKASRLKTAMLCGMVAISMSLVFAVILTVSVTTFGVVGSLVSGLVCSTAFGMGFSTGVGQVFWSMAAGNDGVNIQGSRTFALTFIIAFGITFGMIFSTALSNVSRSAFGVCGSVIAIMIVGMVSSSFNNLPAQLIAADILGSLRIFFYPVQLMLVLVLHSQIQSRKHPVEWDELSVLPLLGTQQLVTQRFRRNEAAGLNLVSEVARNPFQRWAAQKALKTYFHTHAAPLHLLYKLLVHPDLNAYVCVPVSKQDWERLPTMGHLLLGELGGEWVNYRSDWANHFCERLVWYLTWSRRDRRKTHLTRFAGMLYHVLDEGFVESEYFHLSAYHSIYADLTDYPGGVEIERSFQAMASFLSYKELSALPTAADAVSELPPEETAIRSTVLKALNRLRDIASEVTTYLAATSRVNKQAALLRATDALKTLDEYVTAEVVPPEQTIIRRIIRQWLDLIIEEGGEVGRDEILEPVANPYVVGNPVTNHLFIGREDIMRRLEELWMVKGQCPSVVIYGHRRMGKSSILRNLGASLGSQTTVVDFNMQRVGLVDSTGELIYNFALSIYDALSVALQGQLGEPDAERFCTHNPFTALDRFLKQLDSVRAGQRFIVTIDEFELIEQLIEQKRLELRLLDFWRGLIQTYPWFVLAFAGLHTLQEMTQNYWNPLFGSVTAIPVSFLSPKAAERLITQPSPDFNLDYDVETIAEIIQLTNGQPYLVQLVGHTLVTRFNRQMFEERIKRDRRFTLEDVNAVINTPEFYRDGNAYFNGVWVQAENSKPAGQTAILEALCQADLSITEIAEKTGLSCDLVQAALLTLQRHDVIKQQNGQYVYTVELMRRWVAQRISVQQ